jgi:hypothetical protein
VTRRAIEVGAGQETANGQPSFAVRTGLGNEGKPPYPLSTGTCYLRLCQFKASRAPPPFVLQHLLRPRWEILQRLAVEN